MPHRTRLAVAAILGLTLLISASSIVLAAPTGMKAYRAAGDVTQGGISAAFNAKVGSSSTTWAPAKGTIHLVFESLDFRGTAVCGGTTTTGNRWAQYVSTNFGSAENPEFEAMWINYRDDDPDAFLAFSSEAAADCAALAAFALHDNFQPGPIDSGWITVR